MAGRRCAWQSPEARAAPRIAQRSRKLLVTPTWHPHSLRERPAAGATLEEWPDNGSSPVPEGFLSHAHAKLDAALKGAARRVWEASLQLRCRLTRSPSRLPASRARPRAQLVGVHKLPGVHAGAGRRSAAA